MDLNTFFIENRKEIDDGRFIKNRDRIICADGFTLSVQASRTHYCTPRDDVGPYSKVEIGFPSEAITGEIVQYAENKNDLKGTVYAWVPIALIEALIEEHGGVSK